MAILVFQLDTLDPSTWHLEVLQELDHRALVKGLGQAETGRSRQAVNLLTHVSRGQSGRGHRAADDN